MNQIIGPKLSKSDTFYESLLTVFSSENGCVGQGLSDPSVFRQLENDGTALLIACTICGLQSALTAARRRPPPQRLKGRHVCRCYGSAEAETPSKRSYRNTFSASCSNAQWSPSGAQRTASSQDLASKPW